MKSFCLKFIIFILPLISIFGFIEYKLSQMPNSYIIKKQLLDRKAGKIQVLITGTSHAYTGINPNFWNNIYAFDIANNSQDLTYDFLIVNKYIPRMKNLRLVIIPISYFSYETKLENSVEDWRKYFYFHFFHIPYSDFNLFSSKNYSLISLYGPTKTRELISKNFNEKLTEKIDENGFSITTGQLDKEVGKSIGSERVNYFHQHMNIAFINDNKAVLIRLIHLCFSRNVIPVFITTPASEFFYDYIHEDTYERMQNITTALSKKYSVRYINYFHDKRFVINDFSDSDHLNSTGAAKLSKIIYEDIIKAVFQLE